MSFHCSVLSKSGEDEAYEMAAYKHHDISRSSVSVAVYSDLIHR